MMAVVGTPRPVHRAADQSLALALVLLLSGCSANESVTT